MVKSEIYHKVSCEPIWCCLGILELHNWPDKASLFTGMADHTCKQSELGVYQLILSICSLKQKILSLRFNP